jgi:hypothetical protein
MILPRKRKQLALTAVMFWQFIHYQFHVLTSFQILLWNSVEVPKALASAQQNQQALRHGFTYDTKIHCYKLFHHPKIYYLWHSEHVHHFYSCHRCSVTQGAARVPLLCRLRNQVFFGRCIYTNDFLSLSRAKFWI